MSANKIRKHARVELVLVSPVYTALLGEHHNQGVQESTAVYIYRRQPITEAPTCQLTSLDSPPTPQDFSALYCKVLFFDVSTSVIVKSIHPRSTAWGRVLARRSPAAMGTVL